MGLGASAGAFERPVEAVPGLQLDPWVLGGGAETVRAEVWFDPVVARTVRAELDPDSIRSDDDDGLVAMLDVANRDGFRSWVLTFLDRAEVRSPSALRDEIEAWLSAIAAGGSR